MAELCSRSVRRPRSNWSRRRTSRIFVEPEKMAEVLAKYLLPLTEMERNPIYEIK
jgi:hypothetical protein